MSRYNARTSHCTDAHCVTADCQNTYTPDAAFVEPSECIPPDLVRYMLGVQSQQEGSLVYCCLEDLEHAVVEPRGVVVSRGVVEPRDVEVPRGVVEPRGIVESRGVVEPRSVDTPHLASISSYPQQQQHVAGIPNEEEYQPNATPTVNNHYTTTNVGVLDCRNSTPVQQYNTNQNAYPSSYGGYATGDTSNYSYNGGVSGGVTRVRRDVAKQQRTTRRATKKPGVYQTSGLSNRSMEGNSVVTNQSCIAECNCNTCGLEDTVSNQPAAVAEGERPQRIKTERPSKTERRSNLSNQYKPLPSERNRVEIVYERTPDNTPIVTSPPEVDYQMNTFSYGIDGQHYEGGVSTRGRGLTLDHAYRREGGDDGVLRYAPAEVHYTPAVDRYGASVDRRASHVSAANEQQRYLADSRYLSTPVCKCNECTRTSSNYSSTR